MSAPCVLHVSAGWMHKPPASIQASGCTMLHAVVALPEGLAAAVGSGAGAPHGAVMMWPLRQIRRGEEVTRDQLPGTRSLQRGASLLALLGEPPRHASPRALAHPHFSCFLLCLTAPNRLGSSRC